MNRFKYISAILFLGLIYTSCTERIELSVDKGLERWLSVDASLSNEKKAHAVILKSSKFIDEQVYLPISGADVSYVVDGMETVLQESDSLEGHYFTPPDFAAEVGKTYTLNINNVDVDGDGVFEFYTAQEQMPDSIILDSVTLKYDDFPFIGKAVELQCWAWDPPTDNWYDFKALRNDTLVTDTLNEYQFTDDAFFNGNYTNGVGCQYLRDDKVDEYVNAGDTVTLQIHNITESYFEYLVGAQSEYFGFNPIFGGPPANVGTNLSDGAIGIFRLYFVAEASAIAQEYDREEQIE